MSSVGGHNAVRMNVISFDEAARIVVSSIGSSKSIRDLATRSSIGFACAEEIQAVITNPRFDNSAVDGYAILRREDARPGTRLRVEYEIPAGSFAQRDVNPGECARIFTGAPVPANCFAIAMQEDVQRDGEFIVLQHQTSEGANIRRAGSDIAEGEVLVQSGEPITPESLALICSQGITSVQVFEKPRVALLSTGNELRQVGEALGSGDIYETNIAMLHALLEATMGIVPVTAYCKDDPVQTDTFVAELSAAHDMVVISGGASVGDHDFVPRAIKKLGTTIFHGVAMRPGKPLLFGKVRECFVFGLPGNPASSFVGFILFVLPGIKKLSGWVNPGTRWIQVRFGASANAHPRDDFLRCKLDEQGIAQPVGHQGSFGLRSLASADCLVRLPSNRATYEGEVRFATLIRGSLF